MKSGEWLRGTWPKIILSHQKVRGIKYGRKLSLLEGYATLQAAFTWAMQGQEQGGMCMNCDNIGFTWAFYNGNSKDELVYTLAKALSDMADGLGIVIQVFYQRRRSELGDQAADHLSKGEWKKVEAIWPEGVQWTGRPSRVLATWIERPRFILDLGRKLLLELSERLAVQVGRDYRSDMKQYDGRARNQGGQ